MAINKKMKLPLKLEEQNHREESTESGVIDHA